MDRKDFDTVIVGAGPSGLLSAIGLLKKNQDTKILILEKRDEYTRRHVVRFKHAEFAKYMKAIGGENINEFVALEKRLRKNSAIRINELEEILKTVALRMGVQIEHEEFQNVQKLYEQYPNLKLVIGCDGTHSTVSDQVFGKENMIKHEFDYVLQVRFEISGSVARKTDLPTWPAYLQAYGLAGEEIFGKTDNGKTPVTMQIMISRDDFYALKPYALSKDPIRPFNEAETNLEHIPLGIMKKVKGYLGFKLAHYIKHEENEFIDMSDVRLSVNEAPATRAKSVVTYQTMRAPDSDKEQEVCIMLAGDAALGLSYFKGMNSCLANIVRAQSALHAAPEDRKAKLEEYQTWFDQDLVPRKIKEVADYSKYIAGTTEKLNIFMNWLLGQDFIINTAQAERYAELYYLNQREGQESFLPYPHRKNYFFPVLNTTPLPLSEYKKKIRDHATKYFRVYKSDYYFYSDLLQPLNAVRHIMTGILKLVLSPIVFIVYMPVNLGAFFLTVMINLANMAEFKMKWEEIKLNFKTTLFRMLDGLAETGFGIILAATSIMWPARVLVNLTLTNLNTSRQIENNPGMLRLGAEAAKIIKEGECSTSRMHALLIDMHRKFEKSLSRKQETQISREEEHKAYHECKLHDLESYKHYFKLFGNSELASQEASGDEIVLPLPV